MANKIQANQAEIERALVEIVAKIAAIDVAKVSLERELRGEYLVDSLSTAEFVMGVEEAFDIELENDAVEKAFKRRPMTVRTVAELVRVSEF